MERQDILHLFALTYYIYLQDSSRPAPSETIDISRKYKMRTNTQSIFYYICYIFLHVVFTTLSFAAAADRPVSELTRQLESARAGRSATIRLEPGRYRLGSSVPEATWVLRDLEDCVVDATGVTLIVSRLDTALRLESCRGVVLRGLSVDYDPLPFTQGTIVSIAGDRRGAIVALDAGYPDGSAGLGARLFVHEPSTGRWRDRSSVFTPKRLEPLSDGRHRLVLEKPLDSTVLPGDRLSMPLASKSHAVIVRGCERATFEAVTVHASPHFGILETDCSGNRYAGVRVVPGPIPAGATRPRLRSTNWDGLHSTQAARGPVIANCAFAATGDDAIAVHGLIFRVQEARGRDVLCDGSAGAVLRAGDVVRLVSAHVVSNNKPRPAVLRTVVSAQLSPAAGAGRGKRPAGSSSGANRTASAAPLWTLTLDRPLEAAAGDALENLSRCGTGTLIDGNRIEQTGSRGIVVKSRDGVIRGNRISHTHTAGIMLLVREPEGPFSENILVEDNVIAYPHAQVSAVNPMAGAIAVIATSLGDWPELLRWGSAGHARLRIARNRLENVRGPGIQIEAASQVEVFDNAFLRPHERPGSCGTALGIDGGALVWIARSDAVIIRGNTVSGAAPALAAPHVRLGASAGSVTGERRFATNP